MGVYLYLLVAVALYKPLHGAAESTPSTTKRLLIGAMFPMSGNIGWTGGIGCKPAVEMALRDVNKNQNVLPGYNLSLHAVDSQCEPGRGLHKMYGLLYDDSTKLVLMTGCSGVSTFVAQAAKGWNLIVLSYGSSSPALSERSRFPTFFRTHPSATLHNPTRLKLFKKYNWTKIAIIQQTEEVFTSTIKDLENEIEKERKRPGGAQIEISVRQSFQTDPSNAVDSLKKQDARIIVGVFYEDMARKVFCQAYRKKMFGKRYTWLIIGWYPDMWYTSNDDNIDCTADQLKEALEGHITTEVVQYNLKEELKTDVGLTTLEFRERLEKEIYKHVNRSEYKSLHSVPGYVEAPLAYDAIWALSFALKRTIGELAKNGRALEDFTYEDQEIKDAILYSLNKTDFLGVSGQVSFTSTGDRIAKTQIEQMQDGSYVKIGYYNYIRDNLTWLDKDIWPGGVVTQDSTKILPKYRYISPPLRYIMGILALLGVVFSALALLFNFKSRRYSLVSNSAPHMNSLIAFGCIVTLVCVPLFSLDGEILSHSQYESTCQIRTWFLSIGFTISYGTMFVKVLYSWRLTKKSKRKNGTSKGVEVDNSLVPIWEPYVILTALILTNVIILTLRQMLNPLYLITETFEKQSPEPGDEHFGEDILYEPKQKRCFSKNMSIWMGVMYGYKGCLLIFGLFLAYETRSVKINQMNDLRFVSMAVYNVVVLCLIAVPVTLIIPSQPNASFAFVSLAVILSCYLTVGLLFLPKVIPILVKRIDMDEQSVQQSLLNHETEKKYEQLKEKTEGQQKEIAMQMKKIAELHAVLQKRMGPQMSDDGKASDSAFSEEGSNQDRFQELSDTSNTSKNETLEPHIVSKVTDSQES